MGEYPNEDPKILCTYIYLSQCMILNWKKIAFCKSKLHSITKIFMIHPSYNRWIMQKARALSSFKIIQCPYEICLFVEKINDSCIYCTEDANYSKIVFYVHYITFGLGTKHLDMRYILLNHFSACRYYMIILYDSEWILIDFTKI